MTESHPPHPSDEELSAAIDGRPDEAAVAAGAHAAACPRCTYRMEAMRGVAGLLATPPPVDEFFRERAIAAAVRQRPEQRSTRRLGVLLGAAAAVLALLVAVPVLLGGDDGKDVDTAARGAGDATESADAGAAALADLGEFSDGNALRAALAPRVGEELISAPQSDALRSDDAAAASTTTAAQAFGQTAGGSSSGAGGGVCLDTAEREYGDRVDDLLFSATLSWTGQPAVVYVFSFQAAQGPLDKLALVFRRVDCTLLTSVSM